MFSRKCHQFLFSKYKKAIPVSYFVARRCEDKKFTRSSRNMHKPRVSLVGIGGAGRRLLDSYPPNTDIQLIYISTDPLSLKECYQGVQILIPKSEVTPACRLSGCVSAEIYTALGAADKIVLVAGLGGGTGTGVLPKVYEIAKRCKATVMSVVFIPFKLEAQRRRRALTVLSEENSIGNKLHVVDLEALLDVSSKSTSLNDFLGVSHLNARQEINRFLNTA